MQRIPEPELMDSEEQAAAYAHADFSAPHDAFVDALGARFPDFTGGRVLDLGCGPADITVRVARRYPKATFVGVDAGPEMLRHGSARVEREGLSGRVTLRHAHLPDEEFDGMESFDAVISNSLLHHLADADVLWSTASAATRPGGAVFVMDLRRAGSVDAARALTDRYASLEPEVLREDMIRSLGAAYTADEVRAQLAAAPPPVRAFTVEELGDRHLLVWGTRR